MSAVRQLLRYLSCTCDSLSSRFPATLSHHPLHSSPALSHYFATPFLKTHKVRSSSHLNTLTANFSTCSYSDVVDDFLASTYLSVRIRCPRHVADELSEALLSFGANSTSMDEDDSWGTDEMYISSTFPEGGNINTCISHAANSIGLKEIPTFEVSICKHEDWVRKTQDSFHPVEITKGLWVVPEWRTPPDAHATNIILNPGLAFGTGDHPTTKLCLLLLKDCIKMGETFFDYGTGSGILAIAALKFGAALAVGMDIDPVAITSAHQNAALNDIDSNKMKLYLISSESCPPAFDPICGVSVGSVNQMEVKSDMREYDVVIANILLNPLLDLRDHILSYAKPGAVIGLSGILSEQIPRILEWYSPLLEGMEVSELDDWACICGRKKGDLAANLILPATMAEDNRRKSNYNEGNESCFHRLTQRKWH